MDPICPNGNKVIKQGGLVIKNTVLRASHSSEHLGSQNCDVSKGERLKSGQLENHTQEAKTLTVSSSLEEIESTGGGSDLRAKVPRRVEGSETELPVKKHSAPKIDKKLLAVTKNLLVILVAFVICFIPYAVSLCLPKSCSALPWLLALLSSNSCINPIIYARRIRAFREVMVCIIRCRLGSIPMPIDLVRKMRTTRWNLKQGQKHSVDKFLKIIRGHFRPGSFNHIQNIRRTIENWRLWPWTKKKKSDEQVPPIAIPRTMQRQLNSMSSYSRLLTVLK